MTNELKSTKDNKGWLNPYLLALDMMFYKRWDYWTRAVLADRIPEEPIPHIEFVMPMTYPEQAVKRNLKSCLDRASTRYSNVFEKFIDWLLWGFNQGKSFPGIDEKIDDYWYRHFNLGLFYKEPADHLADLVTQYNGNHGGYFPTPANVVQMMTQISMGDKPQHKHKRMSVMDPCSGSGIMLLYASNYSLNLFGQDISNLMCKVALVNAFIYVPWLAYRPKHLTMFECDKSEIKNIDLPTGVVVYECERCQGRVFNQTVKTPHKVEVKSGQVTLSIPTISTDIIGSGLKPENLTCMTCSKEEGK